MSTTQAEPPLTTPQAAQAPELPVPTVIVVQQKGNGLGITGFVLALIGTLAGLIPLLFWIAFPLGALGFIFSGIGWRHATTEPARGGKGLSIAGTILGVIALVLAVVGFVIVDNAFG